MVYIFLAEGFEEIEALCPYDLLLRAGIDAFTVSITDNIFVTGGHNITVKADKTIAELDSAVIPDMVFLPGGLKGAANLDASDKVKEYILKAYDNNKYIAAICAAPYIIGKMNLLAGKNAVCYPGYENDLKGAVISAAKVVRDGNFITGKGMGVSLQFGLKLVEILKDAETAEKIKLSVMAD
jgi:4-methyl-5(b-hydroxyethyl)-thiazole monophosphate biosynthesis